LEEVAAQLKEPAPAADAAVEMTTSEGADAKEETDSDECAEQPEDEVLDYGVR
jgi:hypothetical protein